MGETNFGQFFSDTGILSKPICGTIWKKPGLPNFGRPGCYGFGIGIKKRRFLLDAVVAIQEGDNLSTAAQAIGIENASACTGGHAVFNGP